MTQDQLNELTVLLERATPGPWTWGAKYLCSRPVGEEYKRLATALEPDSPKWCANAALIVALRNHAPALLAAATRLADLERLREAVACPRSRGPSSGGGTAANSEIAALKAKVAELEAACSKLKGNS